MKVLIILIFSFFSYTVVAQEDTNLRKKTKKIKQLKVTNIASEFVVFDSNELGQGWSFEKEKDKLIYDPDSMRQTSIYNKYIFSLKEFKKAGGNPDSSAKIFYTILDSKSKNSTPSDPNMPSPDGGFTFITHTCKITKVEKK